MTDRIAELCRYAGIRPEYRGYDGRTTRIARETRIAVLNAMGFDVSSDAHAHENLLQLRDEARLRPAPTELIVPAGRAAALDVSRRVEWRLEAEATGEVLSSGAASDRVSLPALPIGVYPLVMSADSQDFTTWVLARPARAVTLGDRAGAARSWGVTAAIYGMTDGGATLIGDYDLLGEYAAAMAMHGADFLGVNPIHAMGRARPDDVISPYSPSHREFLNTWHIAGASAAGAGPAEMIDYPAALRANADALIAAFNAFRLSPADAPTVRAFGDYRSASGAPLREYALFEALASRLGPDWRAWPGPYRTRDPAALAAFANENAAAISQTEWAQWVAENQLKRAQTRATAAGMRIGLYLDLAVGPRLGGAETWAEGSPLVTGATLGAPPDPLGPEGQSWGLAPLCPRRCRAQGYAGFARLLRTLMRHAGMIRIDHILGLMRSFWIPEGGTEGAYVDYPFDALLAVVAIESARSGTIVIGEDLGLVPEGFRDRLAASGVYGLEVLQYMRDDAGGFADTSGARELAACAFATHDTPTINGFFAAEDARLRAGFGTLDKAAFDDIRADREVAKLTLGDRPAVPEIHRKLACARSQIAAVQLDDVAGATAQQNLPGTIDEHPNWRRSAPFPVRDIETSAAFARLGSEMRAQGRANLRPMEKGDDLQDRSDLAD